MGLFKPRNNKKFDYTPRHYDDKGEGSPYKISHKFDAYRKTAETPKGVKNRMAKAWDDFKNTPDRDTNRRVLLIAAVLILIFLFLIEFDLSIFLSY